MYNNYTKDKLIQQMMKLSDEKRDFFEPIGDQTFEDQRLCAYYSQYISSRNTYTIKKLDPKEIEGVLFIKSAIMLFDYLSYQFRMLTSSTSLSKYYLKLLKTLEKMNYFLLDQSYLEQTSELDTEISPNPLKQQFMKDFGVIDLIMEIVYYPLKNQLYTFDELKPNLPFTQTISS